MSLAYYNEFDPFAAAWLQQLIAAGHIAPGVVDTRSIEDVTPDELAGFTQCHFFAGIGVWSYALRQAGWRDDQPVWTGSCPCQPFSAAGKGGGFADERHLWPAFLHLIQQCGPTVVFGEQVASKDGLAWLDLVRSDLEGTGRSFAAADLCAAGVGAPHIRQRPFWVAHADGGHTSPERQQRGREQRQQPCDGRDAIGLDDDDDARSQGYAGDDGAAGGRQEPRRPAAASGVSDRLGDAPSCRRQHEPSQRPAGVQSKEITDAWVRREFSGRSAGLNGSRPTGPTNGFWQDADWLYCRDGKWRPVEPGTFPLAHGAANRVGRLRGYGNAIVAPVAQTFIESVMNVLCD